MKKHLCLKLLELEPMDQHDAEDKLGRKINNLTYGTNGYLTLDLETMELDWKAIEEIGEVRPYDSAMDIMCSDRVDIRMKLKFYQAMFRKLLPNDEIRKKVHDIRRRLAILEKDLDTLIQLNSKYTE